MADDTSNSNTEKDPSEWVTGEEPMTGAQASYLKTLSQEAGEQLSEDLTKAEASARIEELQEKTGRGTASAGPQNGGMASAGPQEERGGGSANGGGS
jgi:hypothetical protein